MSAKSQIEQLLYSIDEGMELLGVKDLEAETLEAGQFRKALEKA